jgi:integral membrane protein
MAQILPGLPSFGAMLSLPAFRRLAVVEATSFLLLLAAAVVKRTADAPIGVSILGPIHGLLFLAYVFVALQLKAQLGWDTRTTALVLLGAVLPFGGYVVDRRLAVARPVAA